MSSRTFTGTGTLIKLALRRDRIKLTVWLASIALLVFSMTASYVNLLKTDEDVVNMITTRAESPAMRIFDAPASGASIGGFTMLRGSVTIAVLIALMSMQTVVRHTRQNEETGRAELIASTVVGRHAALSAALTVTLSANLAAALLIALAFIGNGLPVTGSLAAGAAFGALGIAFTGIAAVTSQLSESSRGANGMAGAALGAAFLLSSVGNTAGEFKEDTISVVSAWPAWLSPFGWYQQVHSFHQNNWWMLGLSLALFVLTTVLAFYLVTRRDVGMGILPASRGPAAAPSSLLSPLGLAWRLQRGLWYGWAIGMVVLGTVMGAAGKEMQEMISDLDQAKEMFGSTGLDAVMGGIISMMGMFLAVYIVQALLRMRSEESDGLVESVLAGAVSRGRWMMSHISVAALGSIVILLLMGLGAAISASLVVDDSTGMFSTILKAALIEAPAILALGGFVILVFGLLPRLASALSWAGLALSLIAGPMFAVMFNMPEGVQKISPFTHVPLVPMESITAGPIASMLGAAILLTGAGMMFFRRRNLSM
jgi:ABC-2 type transport system permease protein